MTYECDNCGLAPCDLPAGVDPELIFEREAGVTLCQGCELLRPLVVRDAIPTQVGQTSEPEHRCGHDYDPYCSGCVTAYGDAGLTQDGQ